MRAAKRRHLNVSQFVLQTCLEAAEKVVQEEEALTTILVSAEEYNWLMQKLEEPPQEVPHLRRLLAEVPCGTVKRWLNFLLRLLGV